MTKPNFRTKSFAALILRNKTLPQTDVYVTSAVWPDLGFLTGLGNIFLVKRSPIFGDFLGYFEDIPFDVKTAAATFWVTFMESWTNVYFSIWSHIS